MAELTRMSKPGWWKAVELAGGAACVARAVGLSRTAVYEWRKRGVPAEHVPPLAALSGMGRHEIRPDLYEDPKGSQVAA